MVRKKHYIKMKKKKKERKKTGIAILISTTTTKKVFKTKTIIRDNKGHYIIIK